MTAPLLEARNLTKHFRSGGRFTPGGRQTIHALDSVSLAIHPGETLGLVGESGCGKSTLGRCLLRLYTPDSGTLIFAGQDITRLPERTLRPLRAQMQMVFQDPAASLNPRRRVGDLIAEPLLVHRFGDKSAISARLLELMALVGLAPDHLTRFPHEFSGGQRQRIGIARALALSPRLIVADEPVSALDVSIQAQIVNLLADLQTRLALTLVFIAHDLAVIRQVATRIAVMYLGQIVELGDTETILRRPAHPYTAALISAVPTPDPTTATTRIILPGDPPSPANPPQGCRFHTRCALAQPICAQTPPTIQPISPVHTVACHFPLTIP